MVKDVVPHHIPYGRTFYKVEVEAPKVDSPVQSQSKVDEIDEVMSQSDYSQGKSALKEERDTLGALRFFVIIPGLALIGGLIYFAVSALL